jgi:hypothetical protein
VYRVDAVLTVNLNSVRGVLTGRQQVSGPPRISTWNWPTAMESAAVLARLKPDVLACGHGRPMTGAGTAERLTSFSAAYGQKASRLSDPYTSRISLPTMRCPAPGRSLRLARAVARR